MRYCEQCGSAFQWMRTCPRDGVPTRADLSDPIVATTIGGRYTVLERIGAGGMGQVYRAAHARIATLFALKVLYGDLAHDAQMRVRFEREAEVASALQSRYIVRVTDFGETPSGLLYIAMEYLAGHTLAERISRDGALPAVLASRVAEQIARGVAHAHERGVVHRDLKPENVMLVTEDDEHDVVKLLDFGLAQLQQGQRLTRAGQVFGTPAYMAPERFGSAEADARSDLYALGVVLYEMLTGTLPFQQTSLLDLEQAHTSLPPAPLANHPSGANAPAALRELVEKLLAKDPSARPASARAVVTALRAINASVPAPALNASGDVVQAGEREVVVLPAEARDRIYATITFGAPAYNRGDHAACYAGYRRCAEELLAGVTSPMEHTVAAARLSTGLRRAAEHGNPTDAAWEMRHAFDDLLAVPTIGVRGGGGWVAEQVRGFQAVAAARSQAGELALVADYHLDFVRQMFARLQRTGGPPAILATLSGALERARQVALPQALEELADVIESLAAPAPAAAVGTAPTLASVPSRGAYESTTREILRAIATGVPLFNSGDAEGCARVYRLAAEAAVASLGADPNCVGYAARIARALSESVGRSPSDAAWVLRNAFDEVLATRPG